VVAGVAVPDPGELERALRPSRRPLLIAGAVAVVAAVVGGYFALRPDPAVKDAFDAGVPTLAVVEDAGGAVEPEVDAGAPSEFAAFPEADAGAGTAVALAEDAGTGEEDDGPDDAGALTKKPKKKGKMNVITTRGGELFWAQVSIDGTPRGRTPLLLDLPAGKYQVRVERSGFKPQERVVRIASGKNVVVKLELVQN
jgi:hypothetical protein